MNDENKRQPMNNFFLILNMMSSKERNEKEPSHNIHLVS